MNRLRRLFRFERASGLLMIGAMLLALAAANSPLAPIYEIVHHTPVHFRFGPLVIDKPLVAWINQGLMVFFFLLVGLEIKRQAVEGRLSTPAMSLFVASLAFPDAALAAAAKLVILVGSFLSAIVGVWVIHHSTGTGRQKADEVPESRSGRELCNRS